MIKHLPLPSAMPLLLLLVALAPCRELLAAPPVDGDAQIRQQRDRDRQDLERLRRFNDSAIDAPQKDEAMPVAGDAKCFEIEHLVLQGVTSLVQTEIKQLQGLVEGRCVGMAQLGAILKRITNLYINKGYVTARAYILEQSIASGRLEILVVEGVLEAIEAGEPVGVNLQTAFPALAGELLNLRDFEQGLAQINRLQSNNASMTLEPGSEPGFTQVVIHNTPGKRWSGDVSWDNNDGLADSKINIGLGYDNALGLNDYFSLRLRKDTAADQSAEYSENLSLNGVLPYGRWTFSMMAAYLRYSSHFSLQNNEIESRGNSASWYFNADRLLHRSRAGSLSLAMSLSHRDTRNFLNDAYLDVSSRKLSAVKLGLNGYWLLGRLRLSGSANVNKGLKILAALQDPSGQDRAAPQAQFLSYDARLAVDAPLSLGSLRSNISTSLAGQYSRDALFGSQHFTVAGFSAVRGYEGSAAAARGAYSRSEWSVQLPYSGITWLDNSFKHSLDNTRLRTFVAYDYGETFARFGNHDQRFSSWTVGLSGRWQKLSVDLVHSKLIHSDRSGSNDSSPAVTHASMRYLF